MTFDYKDYAEGARHKPMQLALAEFIRRLRLHFLPPRFVKIRHYGLLANRRRQQRLARARALLPARPAAGAASAPSRARLPICPHCGWAAFSWSSVVPPLRFAAPARTIGFLMKRPACRRQPVDPPKPIFPSGGG